MSDHFLENPCFHQTTKAGVSKRYNDPAPAHICKGGRKTEHPDIEVTCTVYNINPGFNQDLWARSKVLSGYMYFVNCVRDYLKNQGENRDLETAIEDLCAGKTITELEAAGYDQKIIQKAQNIINKHFNKE